MVGNITFGDYFISYYHHIQKRNIISAVLLYRRKFRNYLSVIMMHRKRRYPFKALLKNGQSIEIRNPNHLYSILLTLNYNPDNDIVTVNFNEHNLKIYRGIDNGDITGIFHNDCYRFLPSESRTVVDIGANIGDSALYFACKKAKKVIALEPYIKNFTIAKENIETNNLSDKIEFLLAACSNKSGNTRISEAGNNVFMPLEMSNTGTVIELMRLEDIVSKYQIVSGVLKMDCEGSEYPIIMNANDEVLKRFTHIQIEYHYGYRNIRQRLEGYGFRVSVSKPTFYVNKYVTNPKMHVGWLYAELVN